MKLIVTSYNNNEHPKMVYIRALELSNINRLNIIKIQNDGKTRSHEWQIAIFL